MKRIIFLMFVLEFTSCCDSYNDEVYYFEAKDMLNNKSLKDCEFAYTFCHYEDDFSWFGWGNCPTKTEKLTISDGEEIPCNDNTFYKANCYEKIKANKDGYHLIRYYNDQNCKSIEFPTTLSFEFRPVEKILMRVVGSKKIKYLWVENRIKNRMTDSYQSYNIDVIGEFVNKKIEPAVSEVDFEIPSIIEDSIYIEVAYLYEDQNLPSRKKKQVSFTNKNQIIEINLE